MATLIPCRRRGSHIPLLNTGCSKTLETPHRQTLDIRTTTGRQIEQREDTEQLEQSKQTARAPFQLRLHNTFLFFFRWKTVHDFVTA